MEDQIIFTIATLQDLESLISMSQKLWPKINPAEHETRFSNAFSSENIRIFLAKNSNHHSAGFAIFSLRTDYVEGSKKSPTGYLEGIFIESEFRKLGIAKEFLKLGEKWCKENGCSQMGSDTWITAEESRKFHARLGFREEEELVHFLKDI